MTVALLYDDHCNFCKVIVVALLEWDRRGALRPVAIQSDEGHALLGAMPDEEQLASFHLVDDGGIRSAGPALPELFRMLPGGALVAWPMERAPGATAAGYRWIARHRIAISRFVPEPLKARARARLGG